MHVGTEVVSGRRSCVFECFSVVHAYKETAACVTGVDWLKLHACTYLHCKNECFQVYSAHLVCVRVCVRAQ